MADLMGIGRKVVIGNSPLLKSYSAKEPVMYLELAIWPSLYLGLACSDQTPSFKILEILSLKITSAFVIRTLYHEEEYFSLQKLQKSQPKSAFKNYFNTKDAAPNTPASLPKVASTSWVLSLICGKLFSAKTLRTPSNKNSPAADTPPPSTI